MEPLVDRTELLRRLERGYRQARALIAPLSPEQLQAPGAVGAWSIKDLVAHFIAHEQFALRELQHAQLGTRPGAAEPATDAINDRAVAERQRQPAAEVLRAWEESFQQVAAAIRALPDADFDPAGPLVGRLGDTIDGAFGNNTYDHYAEHLPAIEQWVRRAADPSEGRA